MKQDAQISAAPGDDPPGVAADLQVMPLNSSKRAQSHGPKRHDKIGIHQLQRRPQPASAIRQFRRYWFGVVAVGSLGIAQHRIGYEDVVPLQTRRCQQALEIPPGGISVKRYSVSLRTSPPGRLADE